MKKSIIIVIEKETLADVNTEVISTVKGVGTYVEELDKSVTICYTGQKNLGSPEAWDFPTENKKEIVFSRDVFDNIRNGYVGAIQNVDDSVFEEMSGKILFCRPFQMHGLAKRLLTLGFEVNVPSLKAMPALKATGKNFYEWKSYSNFVTHCIRTGKTFSDVRQKFYVIKSALKYVGAGYNDKGTFVQGSYKSRILLPNIKTAFEANDTFFEVHGAVVQQHLVVTVVYLHVQAQTEQEAVMTVKAWVKKEYGDDAIFSFDKREMPDRNTVLFPTVTKITRQSIVVSAAKEYNRDFLYADVTTVTSSKEEELKARIDVLEKKVKMLETMINSIAKPDISSNKDHDITPPPATKPDLDLAPTPEPEVIPTPIPVTEPEKDNDEEIFNKYLYDMDPSKCSACHDGRNPLPLDELEENVEDEQPSVEETVNKEEVAIVSEETKSFDINAAAIADVVVDDKMTQNVSKWLSVIVPEKVLGQTNEEYLEEIEDYNNKIKRGAIVATLFGINGIKLRNRLKKADIGLSGKVHDVKIEDGKVMVVPVQNQQWKQLVFANDKFQLVG